MKMNIKEKGDWNDAIKAKERKHESKERAEKSFKEKVEMKACIKVIDVTRCFTFHI